MNVKCQVAMGYTKQAEGMWVDTESEGGTCMAALVYGKDRGVPLVFVRTEIWRGDAQNEHYRQWKADLLLEGSAFLLRAMHILLTTNALEV